MHKLKLVANTLNDKEQMKNDKQLKKIYILLSVAAATIFPNFKKFGTLLLFGLVLFP